MKKIKYDGSMPLKKGDLLAYQKGGKSVISMRELEERKRHKYNRVACKLCRHQNTCEVKRYIFRCDQFDFRLEEQKMSNYFMLDGKRVPMSDETAESLRKEQPVKWEFGDTATMGHDFRVLLFSNKGVLKWHTKWKELVGCSVDSWNCEERAKRFGYKKTGSIFKEN